KDTQPSGILGERQPQSLSFSPKRLQHESNTRVPGFIAIKKLTNANHITLYLGCDVCTSYSSLHIDGHPLTSAFNQRITPTYPNPISTITTTSDSPTNNRCKHSQSQQQL
ncbi:unnamed protein product, partial [Dovyalis caffra]